MSEFRPLIKVDFSEGKTETMPRRAGLVTSINRSPKMISGLMDMPQIQGCLAKGAVTRPKGDPAVPQDLSCKVVHLHFELGTSLCNILVGRHDNHVESVTKLHGPGAKLGSKPSLFPNSPASAQHDSCRDGGYYDSQADDRCQDSMAAKKPAGAGHSTDRAGKDRLLGQESFEVFSEGSGRSIPFVGLFFQTALNDGTQVQRQLSIQPPKGRGMPLESGEHHLNRGITHKWPPT